VSGEFLISFSIFHGISACNVRSLFCPVSVRVENGDTRIEDIKYCNLRRKSSVKKTTVYIVYLRGLQVLCNGRFLMTKWRGECWKVSGCALRGSEVRLACNKVGKKGSRTKWKRKARLWFLTCSNDVSRPLWVHTCRNFNLVNKQLFHFHSFYSKPLLCWLVFDKNF
jgi:hypothetical protein